jgi:hypothetical protein
MSVGSERKTRPLSPHKSGNSGNTHFGLHLGYFKGLAAVTDVTALRKHIAVILSAFQIWLYIMYARATKTCALALRKSGYSGYTLFGHNLSLF